MAVFTDLPNEILSIIITLALPDKIELHVVHKIEFDDFRKPGKKPPSKSRKKPPSVTRSTPRETAITYSRSREGLIRVGNQGTLRTLGLRLAWTDGGRAWTPQWVGGLLLINTTIRGVAQPLIAKLTTLVINESVQSKITGRWIHDFHTDRFQPFQGYLDPINLTLLPDWVNRHVTRIHISQCFPRGKVIDTTVLSNLKSIRLGPTAKGDAWGPICLNSRSYPCFNKLMKFFANDAELSAAEWSAQEDGISIDEVVQRNVVNILREDDPSAAIEATKLLEHSWSSGSDRHGSN